VLTPQSSQADFELSKQYSGKRVIQVQNKADLPRRLQLPKRFPAQQVVEISCKSGDGIESLKNNICRVASVDALDSLGIDVAVNERQADALVRAIRSLTECADQMRHQAASEFIAQQLRIALDAIGEIVGNTTTEDILSRIFSTFCIGK